MYSIEVEQETDGRWIAEVVELPGVMSYGEASTDAIRAAQCLALRVLADRLENAEHAPLTEVFTVTGAV